MAIIEARGLKKIYQAKTGPVHALDGLDLTVPQGTVQGLLGPNGAGKTTAVKVFTTLIKPTDGEATVAGLDVVREAKEVRRSIGVSGQYAAVDENLTGFENLDMVGRLYHLGKRESRRRATELIEMFDLTAAQNRPVKGFSGGMRRRIDLAGALVTRPKILFLDEPTTGLDPRSRLGMWEVIKNLVSDGTTVLLTTQYLEEADQLADNIAVIDGGKVIAQGTSDELKARIGGHSIELTIIDAADAGMAIEALARHGTGEPRSRGDGRTMEVPVVEGAKALQYVLADLGQAGVELHDAGIRRPTLDDVFLKLTGRAAEEDEEGDNVETEKTK